MIPSQSFIPASPDLCIEQFINQTNKPVFLTGKAGTGKTTLLKKLISETHKNAVVVAPTGIAALNAGGVTIHSFFQLPFAGFIPTFDAPPYPESCRIETKETLVRHHSMNKRRLQMLRNLELLVIDEVSMLRADLLDAMDWTLRKTRHNNSPFGGVQVLFIGDLQQLPPVVKAEEWQVLSKHYAGWYFFHAHVLREAMPVYVELKTVYRQQDQLFVDILNKLRNNVLTEVDRAVLNARVKPKADPMNEEGLILLTTHNHKADRINSEALTRLKTPAFSYEAQITGDFPQHMYPVDLAIQLKVGAQVMFIKNDTALIKQYYNGKMGTVENLTKNEVFVHFPEEKKTIAVERFEWMNMRFTFDESTRQIEEECVGTFSQYPLRLAWAITIHKSQGLSFDKAIIDVSEVFAPGQAYVALSRLRSLNGLVLNNPIPSQQLDTDPAILQFSANERSLEELAHVLKDGTLDFLFQYLLSSFDWYQVLNEIQRFDREIQPFTSRSEKGKLKPWWTTNVQRCAELQNVSRSFRNQLEKIRFSAVDLNYLYDRVEAAYVYFYERTDALCTTIMSKRVELEKKKKTFSISEDLLVIEDLLIDKIYQLNKCRKMMDGIIQQKAFTKSFFQADGILDYRKVKLLSLKHTKTAAPTLLDEDEQTTIVVNKRKSTPKEKQALSTFDRTLVLIKEGVSFAEIAVQRSLSESTIARHVEELIKSEKLEIHEVLSEEALEILASIKEEINQLGLTELKEQLNDNVTYDQLRWYKAHRIR
jgi:hypothetical protein